MSDQAGRDRRLSDYIAVFKRRWTWVLVPLATLPAAAFYLSSIQPERFDASTEVLLSDSAVQDAVGNTSQNTSFRDRLLENEIRAARSDQASAAIADRLGVDIVDIPSFSVDTDSDSDVLIFRATEDTAESAAAVANIAAESYVAVKQDQATASINAAIANLEAKLIEIQDERNLVRSDLVLFEDALAAASDSTRPAAQAQVDREVRRISGQIALLDAQIETTAANITELELNGELALGGTARIVSAARPPLQSSNSPASRNVVLGLIAGSILGAALALLRDGADNKIRSTDDLDRLGIPALGSIPRAGRRTNRAVELARISLTNPNTPQAQAHLKAQTAVRFLATQLGVSNVLVTSASQGEGKTTLASNLAISMALDNVRTVLVDLDLRRPRVHVAYELAQSPGITTVVIDDMDVVDSATLIARAEGNLAVVPAGKLPPHPGTFISSPSFGEAVERLSKLSDFTVFDAPPVLPVADTLTLARMVDGVIVVAYANQTKTEDLATTVASLENSGAQILGGVLLGARDRRSSADYYSASNELERL